MVLVTSIRSYFWFMWIEMFMKIFWCSAMILALPESDILWETNLTDASSVAHGRTRQQLESDEATGAQHQSVQGTTLVSASEYALISSHNPSVNRLELTKVRKGVSRNQDHPMYSAIPNQGICGEFRSFRDLSMVGRAHRLTRGWSWFLETHFRTQNAKHLNKRGWIYRPYLIFVFTATLVVFFITHFIDVTQ
jgi:hypothetical protein